MRALMDVTGDRLVDWTGSHSAYYARKIGLWYAVFLISPFVGPMLDSFMVAGLGEWRPLFWPVFAWTIGLTATIVVFGD
ncbi:hypothetical protein Asppvi_009914 [Aspergillus pseudoviridinutans]|uniref:Uncharacterized protein n=1 Tax=Aspergillus pseudoviridinutans TaxID=1517512 RepID=A0A9P3BII6_9EURO|nr:uncharacterized protein Asppvi_009914 [Aspergillus pseudoviridinutans]GIJ90949.1 hypothetical protein Asppvi_009914 [Aspergillus pseudoviridinutans]